MNREILIDKRVGSGEFYPKINSLNIPCTLTTLNSADFAFLGNGPNGPCFVGVERKTIPDMVSSMISGRFSGHQLIELVNDYDFVYILLEGFFRPRKEDGALEFFGKYKWETIKGSRITYREFSNHINTLSCICGLKVVNTGTRDMDSALWLRNVYSWWGKSWKSHRSHLRFNTTTAKLNGNETGKVETASFNMKKPSKLQLLLKELDGVGYDRAEKIAKEYNHNIKECFLSLFCEDYDRLKSIKGISKGLADKIIKQCNKE